MIESIYTIEASPLPVASCPAWDTSSEGVGVGVEVDEDSVDESADGVLFNPISTVDVEAVDEGSLDDVPDDVAVGDAVVDDATNDDVDDDSSSESSVGAGLAANPAFIVSHCFEFRYIQLSAYRYGTDPCRTRCTRSSETRPQEASCL